MSHQDFQRRALSLLQQQRYQDVVQLCQPVLQRSPAQFAPHHLCGVALLRLERLKEAERHLRLACRCKAPDAQLAQAHNNLALCLQHRGKLDDARQAIEQALKHRPQEAAYWVNKGNISEAQQDWSQMRRAFEKALSLAPHLIEARTGLAVASRRLGELALARQLLEASPEQDYDWLCEYVLVLLLQGHDSQAQGLLGQVPDSESLQGVADYIGEAGHGELAIPLYRQVLRLDPDNATAAHLLASLSGQTSQLAPRSYVEGLYDRHAGQFEQRLVGRLEYRAPELMAAALANLTGQAFASALDLGCGSGLLGQALRQHFPELVIDGIDLSARMLAQARNKGCYRSLGHGDAVAELARMPAARYDLIASTDMLIYLGDLMPLFRAATRCIAPAGFFAVTVESGGEDSPQLQPNGRFRHSRDYLERLTADSGLKLRLLEPFDLRREQGQMIEGLMLVAQAPDNRA